MNDLPKFALSIMQPWAWLIVNGHKDIENRDWPTKFRGPVAIHAGKKLDREAHREMYEGRHPVTGGPRPEFNPRIQPEPGGMWCGGIVGVAEIVDCVDRSDSEWFVGGKRSDGTCGYGFVIRNARPVEFIPVRGALSFFDWRRNLA